MTTALIAAFVAGLVGSPHCVGMCGPFALACAGRTGHATAWHAGKIATYALLGAAAGGLGAAMPGPSWIASALSAALVIWFAAALAGWAPEPTRHVPGLARLAVRTAARDDLAGRFVFGAANGLLPCGLVYAALGLAVATGSGPAGAATMVAFGLGTVPALEAFAMGARLVTAERPWARRALAGAVLLAGLWMVVQRTGLVGDGPMPGLSH